MRRAIVVLAVSLLAAIGLNAQTTVAPSDAQYSVVKDVTLAGTAEAVTIQLPTSGGRPTKVVAVSVYCSAACDYTFERNGTAATTTAATPVVLNPEATPASSTLAFIDSNVGTGTVFYRDTVNGFKQGYGREILPKLYPVNGIRSNFTVRVASFTGRAVIAIFYRQESF